MPFAGYATFDDCVAKNRDKEDPKGYCAVIQRKVEGPRPARGARGARAMREAEHDEIVLSENDMRALNLELKVALDPMLNRAKPLDNDPALD